MKIRTDYIYGAVEGHRDAMFTAAFQLLDGAKPNTNPNPNPNTNLTVILMLLLLLKSVEIDDNVALLRVVEAVSSMDSKMTP